VAGQIRHHDFVSVPVNSVAFDKNQATLYIKKEGNGYTAVVRRPRAEMVWQTDAPMEMEPLIQKLLQLGCNYRDLQDVITEANTYGDGYLP
jgi:hypothetical protein